MGAPCVVIIWMSIQMGPLAILECSSERGKLYAVNGLEFLDQPMWVMQKKPDATITLVILG